MLLPSTSCLVTPNAHRVAPAHAAHIDSPDGHAVGRRWSYRYSKKVFYSKRDTRGRNPGSRCITSYAVPPESEMPTFLILSLSFSFLHVPPMTLSLPISFALTRTAIASIRNPIPLLSRARRSCCRPFSGHDRYIGLPTLVGGDGSVEMKVWVSGD